MFFGFLFELHTDLLAGETGHMVAGAGGLLLVVLTVSGIILWWPGMKRMRASLTVARGKPASRLVYDLHRASGAWTAVLLAVVALSGASLVFPEGAARWAHRLTLTPEPPERKHSIVPSGRPAPLDASVRAAEAALPEGKTMRVTFPTGPDKPLTVRRRYPGEWHPIGLNAAVVDPYTNRVLEVRKTGEASAAGRLVNLRYPVHIGVYAGLASRILHAFLGLVPGFLFATGILVWNNRRRARRRMPRLAEGGEAREMAGSAKAPR